MPIENSFNWVYHLPNDKPFLEGYGMEWFTKLEIQNWSTSPALYMRRVGPYGPENRVLMETFKQWLRTHDLFTADCVIVAAALDNPMQIKPVDCYNHLSNSNLYPHPVLRLFLDIALNF